MHFYFITFFNIKGIHATWDHQFPLENIRLVEADDLGFTDFPFGRFNGKIN